jgi:hypothetical protein
MAFLFSGVISLLSSLSLSASVICPCANQIISLPSVPPAVTFNFKTLFGILSVAIVTRYNKEVVVVVHVSGVRLCL